MCLFFEQANRLYCDSQHTTFTRQLLCYHRTFSCYDDSRRKLYQFVNMAPVYNISNNETNCFLLMNSQLHLPIKPNHMRHLQLTHEEGSLSCHSFYLFLTHKIVAFSNIIILHSSYFCYETVCQIKQLLTHHTGDSTGNIDSCVVANAKVCHNSVNSSF